ncbi:hypothetical protein [Bdellovibrio sp. HCB288]|uniref:hypothetical protein n=1 Tax=Bdellovibrio sp. HCB288 TaxID=3394355 RepID=UPI0039B4CF83
MGLRSKLAVCLILLCGVFTNAAKDTKTDTAASAPSRNWPIEVSLDSKQKVTLFQPQVEGIDNNLITARTAFKIQKDGKDSYGSFLMKADSLIDKDQSTVTLRTIKVADMQLPGDSSQRQELTREFEKALNKKEHVLPYRNVVASLELSSVDKKRKSPQLKNDPPQIIFATSPSLLIMISGKPVMGPSGKYKTPERVVNTSALIVADGDKNFYLWALNKWFSAPSATGPFAPAKSAPTSKITMVKDELVKSKTVDPLEGRTTQGNSIYPPGVTPKIFIATQPTELLQSEGDPKFSAVEKTGLLYMSNSPNSIFLETSSQIYFSLISGRWFNSKSLQGPWKYVPGDSLPKDFAKIPTNSPVAEVLVSVPGTPQAKESLITSSIPQTAQVARSLKPKELKCDGAVKWQKISSSSLQYAENCNTPLIMVNPQLYYIVQDGVWFNSSKESGPWEVSIAVPDQIYQIPSSSPLYYVTYVKIYSTSADHVVVGFTPGYHGTFVSADGTVVYGTGYSYAPYATATAWYPPPETYGFGVGYGYGYDTGFFMGFSMGAVMYPWGWGSCCWGGTYVNIDVTNIYHNWGKTSVITGSGGHGMITHSIGDTKFARGIGSDNLYSSHDGGVYRRNGKGDWSQYEGPNTWSPVQKPDNIQNLERNHDARASRPDTPQVNHSAGPRSPASSTNLRGGMHAGGGGFRGGGGGFRR